jgi:hypothetical protein
LLSVTDTNRYGAAVALLFLRGWRISEALGLGRHRLRGRSANVERGCHDDPLTGLSLGPVKTGATVGLKLLTPGVVARLQARRAQADRERAAAGETWPTYVYEGAEVEPFFLTAKGGLVRRQTIDSLMRHAVLRLVSTLRNWERMSAGVRRQRGCAHRVSRQRASLCHYRSVPR